MLEVHLATPEGISRKGFFIFNNDNLDQLLQRFWETEKLPNNSWTTEGILYERHFEKLAAENGTGRYILKLPQREGQNLLRGSYEEARRWFQFGCSRNIQISIRYIQNLWKNRKILAI